MVVPPKHPKWSFLVGKPMVVGYHHFWKHPYGMFFATPGFFRDEKKAHSGNPKIALSGAISLKKWQMVWWCCGAFASWLYIEKGRISSFCGKAKPLPLVTDRCDWILSSNTVYLHPDRVWRKIWNQLNTCLGKSWLLTNAQDAQLLEISTELMRSALLCGRSGSALPGPLMFTPRWERIDTLDRCLPH